jgi:hypothetical protein
LVLADQLQAPILYLGQLPQLAAETAHTLLITAATADLVAAAARIMNLKAALKDLRIMELAEQQRLDKDLMEAPPQEVLSAVVAAVVRPKLEIQTVEVRAVTGLHRLFLAHP